jgi:hypothetical protein
VGRAGRGGAGGRAGGGGERRRWQEGLFFSFKAHQHPRLSKQQTHHILYPSKHHLPSACGYLLSSSVAVPPVVLRFCVGLVACA